MGAFLDFVMGSDWADRNSQQQFAKTAYDLLKGGADPAGPEFMNGIVKSGWQPKTVDDINGLISIKSMKKKEMAADFDLFKKMVAGGEGLSDEVLPAYAKATGLPEPVFNTLDRQRLKGDIAKAPIEKEKLEGDVANIPMEQKKLAGEVAAGSMKVPIDPEVLLNSISDIPGLNINHPMQAKLLNEAFRMASQKVIAGEGNVAPRDAMLESMNAMQMLEPTGSGTPWNKQYKVKDALLSAGATSMANVQQGQGAMGATNNSQSPQQQIPKGKLAQESQMYAQELQQRVGNGAITQEEAAMLYDLKYGSKKR